MAAASRRCRRAALPGGCIPEQFLDMPVDYESLTKLGSIMGSGGMIVMDETSCMVDVAKFFMEFCMTESCGKCIPCRVGTAADARPAAEDHGGRGHRGRPGAAAKSCATWCKSTSLCGLGQTAPNPVLSTLRYFRDEYRRAHRAARAARRESAQPAPGRRQTGGDRMSQAPVRVNTLTIDGREVGARDDQTILEVARENGIFIPTLCHLPGLSTRGRLPPVPGGGQGHQQAAAGLRHPRGGGHGSHGELRAAGPLPRGTSWSCSSPNATTSARCASPTATATCNRWRRSWAINHVTSPIGIPRLPVDASHERFVVDHNRCILCTRCVRVCDEIEGAHTWDVMGRGVNAA